MIINGMKKCFKCGELKEANTEFFHKDKYKKDGLVGTCKECINKNPKVPKGYKKCSKCKEIKKEDEFYSYEKSNYCKECRKETSRRKYIKKGDL